MKKVLKILLGLILAAGPLYFILPGMSMASWGRAAVNLIKGGITIIVPLIGLALIAMGFSELKE
ncbi:MAG: hypothetical protein PF542_07005 [Nanoarchaeota archaeon]|jgi:hypothetical protein|nr:hypothetical protein [Nanoarchaeota archaeon]